MGAVSLCECPRSRQYIVVRNFGHTELLYSRSVECALTHKRPAWLLCDDAFLKCAVLVAYILLRTC